MMYTDDVGTNHHIEYTSEDNRVIKKYETGHFELKIALYLRK